MQLRLLDILRCPACGLSLHAVPFELEKDSIINGILSCDCGESFPVIHYIPRFLLGDLRIQLFDIHADFYRKFSSRLQVEACSKKSPDLSDRIRTQDSFGYEWTKFAKYNADNFTLFIQPLEKGFFENKFGLDVGCGAGRHVKQATALGAQVIGLDLSHSIDIAFRSNPDNPAAHFIQADILNLPFRKNLFDFIYSLGVLHHLPDPEKGFHFLIPHLKEGASIFIWVYQRSKRKVLLERARRITTRLPLGSIKTLSWVATVVDYGIFVNLYRVFRRYGLVRRWTPLRIKEYATYNLYTNYTDWFDRLSAPISNSYNEAEIRAWFEKGALREIETALIGDSWVWGKGQRA